MKKTGDLVVTLLVIYGILCAISIALYAVIQLFVEDKSTATNLLIWSATIFAPIAVLMTYTSWREQKRSEIIAMECKEVIKNIFASNGILNDIRTNIRLKPKIEIKNKLRLEIESYERLNIEVIRNLLLIDNLVDEKQLFNLIVQYDINHKTIKMILESKMEFYGLKGTSRFEEFYENSIKNASEIARILKNYCLYQKL